MVITEIKAQDVLAGCRDAVGLPPAGENPLDDTLLAALLRRAAGILCPCSRTTLRAALLESLRYTTEDQDSLAERLDAVIEGLIVGGDLLELNDVATIDPSVKGTWVFAAPPNYIVRPGGSVFLTGVVPDQESFLPESLADRIVHEGVTRLIVPEPDEDLPSELHEQGLLELTENVWLKSPKPQTPEAALSAMERQLASRARSGAIEELEILDPARPVTYYRGRWTAPHARSGNFLARRPQQYGAPLWCYVTLDDGAPVKLLDFPLPRSRWRACDTAWHLQMAIDHCRGQPQLYRRRSRDGGAEFHFFSPLPQWSERRLIIFGRPAPREKSLIAYWLPAAEADAEERFLQERLWMERAEGSD